MPSLHSETNTSKSKSADSAHMIVKRLMKKNPRASEGKIVKMFREHMLDEDNYDDLTTHLNTIGSYEYRSNVGAALIVIDPPPPGEQRKKRAERTARNIENDAVTSEKIIRANVIYAEGIIEKTVDLVMTLTNEQAIAMGGSIAKIGQRGKPKALVAATWRRNQVKKAIVG